MWLSGDLSGHLCEVEVVWEVNKSCLRYRFHIFLEPTQHLWISFVFSFTPLFFICSYFIPTSLAVACDIPPMWFECMQVLFTTPISIWRYVNWWSRNFDLDNPFNMNFLFGNESFLGPSVLISYLPDRWLQTHFSKDIHGFKVHFTVAWHPLIQCI